MSAALKMPRDTPVAAGPPPAGRGAAGSRMGVIAALIAVYIIWGSTYLGIRVALEGFPPLVMGGIRFLLAGALLYGLVRMRGGRAPTRKQWRGAAVLAVLLLGLGNGGVTFAEQWVTSSLAALALGATPIWAALFAGLLGRWPGRLEWLGLAIGFSGLAILNLGGGLRASPEGMIVLLLAPVGWALGTVLSPRLALPEGLMASAAEMLIGGALLLVLGLARGERIHTAPGPHAMLALLYLVVFGALVGFSAYSYLLRHVRTSLATSYAYVNPVVAVLLGVTLAGDRMAHAGLVAMPIILGGVALVLLGRERRPRPR
ncbi:MAG TPA: drug/metabolite exporter YedA [Chloroflexota bacterium]|nr:drug/metabolite exporter YedA [Chloroflexota bacterium]